MIATNGHYTLNYNPNVASSTISEPMVFHDPDDTNYSETAGHDGRPNSDRLNSPAKREDRTAVVKVQQPSCLPSYWPSYEGVGRSQQAASVFRLSTRRARQRAWTGRNYHK
jgi:hypothetical protein